MTTLPPKESLMSTDLNEEVGDAGSVSSGGSNAAAREAEARRKSLARQETKAVNRSRLFVLLFVAAAAITVSILVYRIMTDLETESFQDAFDGHSGRVIERFHASVASKLNAIDGLACLYTSEGLREGSRGFPYVTLSDFEVHASNTRIQADTLFFFYSPVITDDIREEWETYANETHGHGFADFLKESGLRAQQDAKFNVTYPDENRRLQEDLVPRLEDGYGVPIWGDLPDQTQVVREPGSGPYVPLWQIAPPFPSPQFLNIDLFTKPTVEGSYRETIKTGEVVFDVIGNIEYDADAVALMNFFLKTGQYRETPAEYISEPVSALTYPVFDSFDVATRKVGGILMTNLYWRLYFEEILPDDGKASVDIVISNTVNQSVTYRIDGPIVEYIGAGDHHDKEFEDYEKAADVTAFVKDRAGPRTEGYVAADLNQDYIRYMLKVYPTKDLESEYLTDMPTVYTAVVASIFGFTSIIFILFIWLVERRQRVVMDSAVKAGAIVSSLFPKRVRDRVFESADPKKAPKEKGFKSPAVANELDDSTRGNASSSHPIADLFPNSTVLFADIVGFTKWSSTRTPSEVFELLEGLYGTFDKLAHRRRVFKVETIGDSYVAATGLPEAQPDHAFRMIRFAQEAFCVKGVQVLEELSAKLGAETADLGFRIGIHSGEITGGVLRGDRSRFQLFGDTINTASRMESTGMKGRIQASQQTVDELIKAGLSNWATPREGLVEAKGKGALQTYWIEAGRGKSTGTFTETESIPPSDHSTGSTEKENALFIGEKPESALH